MKSLLNKLLMLAAVSALAIGIAGCNAGAKPDRQSDASAIVEQVKLRVMWWGSQTRHDATLKALELYTQLNPNITFESDYSGSQGYWDKLATQTAAKNAPDLIQMDTKYFTQYASSNQLADLSDGIDTSGIDQNLLTTGKYKDKLYAVPLGINAYGIVYNKSALDKMGVTLQPDWTWEEMFNLARDIKPKLEAGKYVLRDFSADMLMYESYQMSTGKGPVATADGANNIDEGTWMEWVETFAKLRAEGIVPPADVTVSEKPFDPKNDLLLNGSILIKQASSPEFPSFESVQPGVYALMKMPKTVQSGGYLKPAMSWSVSANSTHAEEAKKFIDWFINDKQAADILGSTRGIPASQNIIDYLSPNFNNTDKMQQELVSLTSENASPFGVSPEGYGNFWADYEKVIQALVFESKSAEQIFEELQKKFSDDFKQAR